MDIGIVYDRKTIMLGMRKGLTTNHCQPIGGCPIRLAYTRIDSHSISQAHNTVSIIDINYYC